MLLSAECKKFCTQPTVSYTNNLNKEGKATSGALQAVQKNKV